MRVYVVVSVYAGCVDKVLGFQDASEAETEAAKLRRELGIKLGSEQESEHDVQLHEIDIDLRPLSVALRRQTY